VATELLLLPGERPLVSGRRNYDERALSGVAIRSLGAKGLQIPS